MRPLRGVRAPCILWAFILCLQLGLRHGKDVLAGTGKDWPQETRVAGFLPQSLPQPGSSVVTLKLQRSSCPEDMPNSYWKLLILTAKKNNQDASFVGTMSTSCENIRFNISTNDLRRGTFFTKVVLNGSIELPIHEEQVLRIVEPPSAEVYNTTFTRQDDMAVAVIEVRLSGALTVPATVGISVQDTQLAKVLEPSRLSWAANELSVSKQFRLHLVAAPRSGLLPVSLVSIENVQISPRSSPVQISVPTPAVSQSSGMVVYRPVNASRSSIDIPLLVTGPRLFPFRLHYSPLLLYTAGCEGPAVFNASLQQSGSMMVPAMNGSAAGTHNNSTTNDTSVAAQQAWSGVLQLWVDWAHIPAASELHTAITLNASYNARVAAAGSRSRIVLFGVSLGQCPPGTAVHGNSTRKDSSTLPTSQSPLSSLRLTVCCDLDGQPVNQDMDPPYHKEVYDYQALVPHKWIHTMPLARRSQLVLMKARADDVVLVAWSSCSAVDSSSLQQVGGPASLSWAIDISRQEAMCSMVVMVLGRLPPPSAASSVLAVAGQQQSLGTLSGVNTAASAAAAAAAAASLDSLAGAQLSSTRETITPRPGDLKAAALAASEAASHAVESATSQGGIVMQGEAGGSVALTAAAPAFAVEGTTVQYTRKAQYNITLVPLSDPTSLRLKALSYWSRDSAPWGCSTLVVVCGVPGEIAEALGASFQVRNGTWSGPKQLEELQAAIKGSSAAAAQLQSNMGLSRVQQQALSKQLQLDNGSGFPLPAAGRTIRLLFNMHYLAECTGERRMLVATQLLTWSNMSLVAEPAVNSTSVEAHGSFFLDSDSAAAAALAAASKQALVSSPSNQSNATASAPTSLVLSGNASQLVISSSQDVENTDDSDSDDGGDGVGAAQADDKDAPTAEAGVSELMEPLNPAVMEAIESSASGLSAEQVRGRLVLPSGTTEVPVIVRAADGVSSRTYSLLLFSNETALQNLTLSTSISTIDKANQTGRVLVDDNLLNTALQAEVYGSRNRSWPAAPAQSCLICPNGTYSATTDSLDCQLCPPGKYAKAPMTASCTTCPPGTFSFSWGSSLCRPCLMGTFSQEPGAQACNICPEGTTNLRQGSDSCAVELRPGGAPGGGGRSAGGMDNMPGGVQYAVVLKFTVVLSAPEQNVAGLSASTTGINASSITILKLLIQADAADMFNISAQNIQLSDVLRIQRDTFLVNVSATVPLSSRAASSRSSSTTPSRTAERKADDVSSADLDADNLVQKLTDKPDEAFPRTSQATGGQVQVSNVEQHVVRTNWDDDSRHINVHAIIWPTLAGTMLMAALLAWGCRRCMRRRGKAGLPWRLPLPSLPSWQPPEVLVSWGSSSEPSPVPSSTGIEVELHDLHALPGGLLAARLRMKSSKLQLDAMCPEPTQDTGPLANPVYGMSPANMHAYEHLHSRL